MAHKHPVYDLDPHFTIDAISRAITNQSGKTILMQYDHNSERFSFEINKLVEGHDITLCNKVEIHYTNADSNRQGANYGVYEVDDMVVDPEDENRVVFTWLVSQNATTYSGSLSFLIVFSCVEDDVVVYRWNTNINNSVSIAKGMNHTNTIVEENVDILEQWRNDLFAAATGTNAISIGPVEPQKYPYIWLDTSENKDITEKNIGYLTIKAADGVRQRMFPVVKASGVEGFEALVKGLSDTHSSDMKNINQALTDETQARSEADDEITIRMDRLEEILTGAKVAIAHSLTGKGVTVPDNMSISDVAALIDGITMDVPTSLQGITIAIPPNQTKYYVSESFNNAGMVVRADFGDGVVVPISTYTVSPLVMSEDTTEVVVSLTVNGVTKTAVQPVEVVASTADNMVAGDLISVPESDDTNAWYMVVDTDYSGNILLVRKDCLDGTIPYFYSAPGTEYATKYEGSRLDEYLNDFYGRLPIRTTSIIESVDIPVRTSASTGASQGYLTRNVFALSTSEWGFDGSALEGTDVEYTDGRSAGVTYWTREPYSGVANYAWTIKADGNRSYYNVTNYHHAVRPAFCIDKSVLIEEVEGGWSLVGSTLEGDPPMMVVDEYGNATITGVIFSVDANGNATITV